MLCSLEVTALLSHQTADLPPPGLREALDLVGRLLPQSQPLLLDATSVCLLDAGQDGRIKSVLQVLLGQSRALCKAHCPDLLGELPALLGAHRPLLVLCQVDQDLDVLPQVQLGAYEDQRRTRTVLTDLWNPPGDQVAERAGADHAVAEEEDVCVLVAQWPEAVQLVLQTRNQVRRNMAPQKTRLGSDITMLLLLLQRHN